MNWSWILGVLLNILERIGPVGAEENAVIGLPVISCEEKRIRVQLQTARSFHGKIFVKGEHANPGCVRDYSEGEPAPFSDISNPEDLSWSPGGANSLKQNSNFNDRGGISTSRSGLSGLSGRNTASGQLQKQCPPCSCDSTAAQMRSRRDTNIVTIDVGLGACNAQRDRIASPPGVRISFVAVVSFHENFITKLDRAYRVQCLYAETDRRLTAEVDVEMQPASNLSNMVVPSSCEYRIRDSTGRSISSVRVGERVTHEWSCQSELPDVYSLLVHNCTVEDGAGQKHLLIDHHGCTTDGVVLLTPSYTSALRATVDAYVFKYPDRAAVDFQCALTLCVRHSGNCEMITPPTCSPLAQSNDSAFRHRRFVPELRNAEATPELSWEIHSPRLFVLDPDDREGESEQSLLEALQAARSASLGGLQPQGTSQPHSLCLSVAAFGLLVATATCVSTTSFIVFFFLLRAPAHARKD